MLVERLVVPPLENNTYLLVDEATKLAVVIDPALGFKPIMKRVSELALKVLYILNTHGHHDHTADDAQLRKATGARLAIHERDAYRLIKNAYEDRYFLPRLPEPVKPDLLLSEGFIVEFGASRLSVLHTPGHTEGSSCFYDQKSGYIFTGDTLFSGTYGRTDLTGGDPFEMVKTLTRLSKLPSSTNVYPGHGPTTTIGEEVGSEK